MLSKETCEACRADAPQVTDKELAAYMAQIPEWSGISEAGILKLRRSFKFSDYVSALSFTNKVAQLAEAVNHHPDILLEWGKVTVTWWSHKIKGLHKNDFIMAAKTDELQD
ncbi:MAG: 4a-hydroxytetrahydrobiopterin dehydratase [Gammaproteobacteria bacterium]|nr:4a-hydroxytetrahydrobiopterin dehydratase [Gammaproteobacteria bacterium]